MKKREGNKMATDTRFQVRDTQEELEKLDKAIKKLGYKIGQTGTETARGR